MRMGPGKHLKGLTLMDGLVTPEEVNNIHAAQIFILILPTQFDYFHELIITQEFGRPNQRGYGDGASIVSHSSNLCGI